MRLDEGEAGAREYGGHAREKTAIDDFGLGKIGDFGGASDVGSGGKKGVLHNGAKENVGAEALGSRVEK